MYSITDKGRGAAKIFEKELPSTVRERAQRSAIRVIREIKRNAGIATRTTQCGEDHYNVSLAIEDGSDIILSVTLSVVNPQQGAMLERNFKKNAEKIYNAILNDLLNDFQP